MTESCELCKSAAFKYKCPTCYVKYCSIPCYRTHREVPCGKPAGPDKAAAETTQPLQYQFSTADTVPKEKLGELAGSSEVRECLSNPHVRNLLTSLVHSKTPDVTIQEAMQEPIFQELALACLRVVEPPQDDQY